MPRSKLLDLLNLSLHKHPIFLCCSSLFSAFLSLRLTIPTYIFLPFRVALSSLSFSLSRTLPYHVEATSFSLCSTDPLLYPLLFLSPFAFIQRGLYFGGLRPVQPRCCQFNEDPTLDNGSIFLLISFGKQHLFSLDLYIAIPFFRFKVSIRQRGGMITRFHLANLYSKRGKYLLKIFAKMF